MAVDLRRLNNLAQALRERTEPASRQRRDNRSWFRIENAASARAEVYIYDVIGEWGVSAQDFVNELRGLRSQSIDLHINSEGGEIFDGVAIYESLRRHSAEVHGFVDGLAASCASFILQACNTRTMARNGRLMVHNAHGWCMGNADDMRDAADLLDDLSENIASIYQERAGGTVREWRDAMRGPARNSGARAPVDGTWYTAQGAVDAGLADEISPGPDGANARASLQPTVPADLLADWDPDALAAAMNHVLVDRAQSDAQRAAVIAEQWDKSKFINMFKEVTTP